MGKGAGNLALACHRGGSTSESGTKASPTVATGFSGSTVSSGMPASLARSRTMASAACTVGCTSTGAGSAGWIAGFASGCSAAATTGACSEASQVMNVPACLRCWQPAFRERKQAQAQAGHRLSGSWPAVTLRHGHGWLRVHKPACTWVGSSRTRSLADRGMAFFAAFMAGEMAIGK